MNTKLEGHPTSWTGKSFRSKRTGEIDKVLNVEKNWSRFSVKIDCDNDFMRYLGYDSRWFRENWENIDSDK